LVQTDWFWFGSVHFLGQKSVQTGFAQFDSVFSGLVWFFSGLSSVWFFQFQAYKTETEPNRSVFFYNSVFSVIFFIFLI
jgi:hypothetical protein